MKFDISRGYLKYDPIYERLYYPRYGHDIFLDPTGKPCSVKLSDEYAFRNSPDIRHNVGISLHVRIELIKDIANKLYLPDGTQCKAAWFDDNLPVLADATHNICVAVGKAYYPSPGARPIGYKPIKVFQPDIKRGNKVMPFYRLMKAEAELKNKLGASVRSAQVIKPYEVFEAILQGVPLDTSSIYVWNVLYRCNESDIRSKCRSLTTHEELRYEP